MYDDNFYNTDSDNVRETTEGTAQNTPMQNDSRGVYSNSNVYPNDYYGKQTTPSYQNYGDGNGNPKKKKEKKKNGVGGKIAICLLMGIVFGGFAGISFIAVKGVDTYLNDQKSQSTGNFLEESITEEQVEEKADLLNKTRDLSTIVTDVTDVVEEVMPTVVSITNQMILKEDYFGKTFETELPSSGSGIIVGENETELLVVTNYHVVADANELKVQFIDGETAVAQIKGTDANMDLAVIAIPLQDLKTTTKDAIVMARLGDSNSLKVGEPAIAIGNALGYGQSVTTGVISALNREIEMQSLENSAETSKSTLIQTDAAINPGNSGGALLNVKGEVVGINSNKIGGSVIEGMGYAIPISAAIPIIEELMIKETKMAVPESQKGYLGISGVAVTADVSEIYGMPEGIYIAQVYEGTGAQKAGLVEGDIITQFDGSKVDSMEELTSLLAYYTKGTAVPVVIMQGSPKGYQEKTIQLTLGGKFE